MARGERNTTAGIIAHAHEVTVNGEAIRIIEENRFSLFLPKSDPEMCDLIAWRDWFLSRGVNACLVERPGGGCAVYRNGLINSEVLRQMRRRP